MRRLSRWTTLRDELPWIALGGALGTVIGVGILWVIGWTR